MKAITYPAPPTGLLREIFDRELKISPRFTLCKAREQGLTRDDIAQQLKVSTSTVRRWYKKGLIPRWALAALEALVLDAYTSEEPNGLLSYEASPFIKRNGTPYRSN